MKHRQNEQENRELKYNGQGSFRLGLGALAFLLIVHVMDSQVGLPDFIHGVRPRTVEGVAGIVFSPFLHGDWMHLFSNSVPLVLSVWGVSYLYTPVRWQVLLISLLAPGAAVWFWDDPHEHIGASGFIYALLAFLFWSGLIRRNPRPIALSLIIVFLYGGMIWRMLPLEAGISWQSHLMGGVVGFLLSIWFRKVEVPDPFRSEDLLEEETLEDEELFHDEYQASPFEEPRPFYDRNRD